MAESNDNLLEGDYDLLESLPDDLNCPVCLSLVMVPVLTSCCGRLFCKDCLQPVGARSKPCPFCNEPNLVFIVNKRASRQINLLRVRCKNRRAGCEWNGQLGQLEDHLATCIHEKVSCTQCCGWLDCRQFLNAHMYTECRNRKYHCKFCKVDGTYHKITEEHYPKCGKYPVQCLNNCDESGAIPREEMEHHLETCKLQPVDCSFKAVGCTSRVARVEIDTHLNTHVTKHIDLMRTWVEQRIGRTEARIQECVACSPTLQDMQHLANEQRTLSRRDSEEQARSLQQELQNRSGHIAEVSRRIARMKQELQQETAQTVEKLKQKHEELAAKLQRLTENHRRNVADIRKTEFDVATALRQSEAAQTLRGTVDQLRDSLQAEIVQVRDEKDAQILSLSGEIDQVRGTCMQEIRLLRQELQCKDTVINQLQSMVPTAPFTFTLVNYEAFCNRPNISSIFGGTARSPSFAYFSPPFYSHIGGYKFCLRVRVYPERLAVHCYIMAGENDATLTWPRRSNLSVTLLHAAVSAARTPHRDVIKQYTYERVTIGDLGTAVGWDTFPVEDLSSYLVNNRLNFRVGITLL